MNSEEIEDSIAGLLAASQQQEKTAKGSVAALAVAVGELKTTSESLKTGVERAISENMGKVSLIAEKAVLEASKASVERLNAASAGVISVQKQFSMLWIFVPAAVILGFAVIACLGVWLATEHWRGELAEAKAAVAQLEDKGGKAILTKCNDNGKSRLCIKVDKKAGGFEDDFMVIKGY
jgi:hypothetical protein